MPVMDETALSLGGRADGKIIQETGLTSLCPQIPLRDVKTVADLTRRHESPCLKKIEFDAGREVHQ